MVRPRARGAGDLLTKLVYEKPKHLERIPPGDTRTRLALVSRPGLFLSRRNEIWMSIGH
jgi:hypothetical protein